ncbi:MAG TPA: molybdopterin cofactor-binding domain-containing protein, partial [bacterium]|nr:molybdopterin cofactor-binding domain-containing protein [bacterium]
MAKLIKTQVGREGRTQEELAVVEEGAPAPWAIDAELKVVGRATAPVDGPERVTGQAVYTADVQLPGMLYARFLRSPYAHARIKRIDISAAERLPGVRAVLSQHNLHGDYALQGMPLFVPEPGYVGDEVALVAADTEAVCEDALRLIRVDYEPLAHISETEKLLLGHSPADLIGLAAEEPRRYARGRAAEGLAQAEARIERTYHTQGILHNCLEPHGAVAAWDGGSLTVWESTQAICQVRDQLAEAFGLPEEQVRVLCHYMGGGFGSKQFSWKWALGAAVLARLTERPVRLVYDRLADNTAAGHRIATTQQLRLGARRDGTLTAIELVAAVDTGVHGHVPDVEGPVQAFYACPNVRTEM